MKNILLHIYDDTGLESRMQAALDLARAFEGHIVCLHATPFEDYMRVDPLVAARLPEEFSERMKTLRLDLKARVEERLQQEGVSWDWIHLDERMSTALVRYSILSDIVVVTLAGSAVEKDEPRPLAAAVATSAPTPVLAVPERSAGLDPAAPALIAWNGMPEAAAAMRASVPLLRLASEVYMLEVEEKLSRYPRDLGARYLSRYGIHVQIVQREANARDVGTLIMDAAIEIDAGLIVMGAYGHSRLREFFMGGVTQYLIRASPVPLLLAH
ncbi:MAG TPA: universal stress protein [Allosphingosinicella sp.]|nr:universal stress protein [Allosphingosinicella sp.]